MSEIRKCVSFNWDKMVHASFRKVVSFDLLFLALGITIGTGLAVAFLTGDLQKMFNEVISIAR